MRVRAMSSTPEFADLERTLEDRRQRVEAALRRLVRRDEAFVRRAWPVVRAALDQVTALQLPFGGIA